VIDTKGVHFIVEASFCDKKLLTNVKKIREILIKAAQKAKMTIKGDYFYDFNNGVSGVVIVAQSHLSIHTWPEEGYAAIDIYTCGDSYPEIAVEFILKEIKCKKAYLTKIDRGLKSKSEYFHSVTSFEKKY